jgi:ferredoxin-NADP reductase
MDPLETTVAGVRDIGSDAVAIDVRAPTGFSALPGQFVKLSTTLDGESVGRFYTISSPDVAETFELTVSYDPEEGGDFSEYLLSLDAGDPITITGPFGESHYENESRVVVLAGGPGIGPAVGIAERALADGGSAAIVYRDDEPVHEDRLASLAAAGADVFVLTEAAGLTDAVSNALIHEPDEQVFIYGFSDFLADAEAALEAGGADVAEVKTENFG